MHLPSQRACRVLGCCLLASALLCLTPAKAVTPNDIRTWYGVGLQQDVRPLIAELRDVASRTRTAEAKAMYNKVLASYPVNELEDTIADYTGEMLSMTDSLLHGIDIPLEDLLVLEQGYYSTMEELNVLLSTRDVITSLTPVEQQEDIDALHESIADLERSISTAGVYADVGVPGVWPAQGMPRQYNSGFGSRWDPITNAGISFHGGVDLKSPMSTPVIAVFSGEVYKTGFSGSSGNYIYLDHGYGVRTFYCHLSEIQVKKGQAVTQGTQIALSGNTGSRSTGPHLHFGVYIDGRAVDPKVVLEHD